MSKHKVTYSIEPQRPSRKGWETCLPHQAQRFAIIQLTHWRRGKHKLRTSRIVASFSGPAAQSAANAKLQKLVATSKSRPSIPRLGGRFPPSNNAPIARSLTSAEYHALRALTERKD